MERRDSLPDRRAVCEVDGCGDISTYRVARGERELGVCRRCVQEMVVLFGWTLTRTPLGEMTPGHSGAIAV